MKKILMLLFILLGSFNSYSITIEQFVEMEDPKLQQGYMIGVIDGEISHNSPESGFNKCALNWLKNDSHASIQSSYEKQLSWMNTSTYVMLEVNKACNEHIEKTNEAISGHVFTLYRNSATNNSMRLHVATFDASESTEYNQENCNLAKDLFQNQERIKTKFWCEKGRFNK